MNILIGTYKVYLSSIRVHQLHWIPSTVSVWGDAGVLVRHGVDAQPIAHQLVVHIPRSEISVARFGILLFPGERCTSFTTRKALLQQETWGAVVWCRKDHLMESIRIAKLQTFFQSTGNTCLVEIVALT